MSDLINRVKNVLDKSRNIWIFPSPDTNKESLQASLALYYSLNKLGKNANLMTHQDISEDLQEITNKNNAQTASILINVANKEVKELSFEKNGNFVKIDLDLKGSQVSLDDITISTPPESKNPDLIFTVGVQRLSDLEDLLEENFRIFYEKPIVNIDNKDNNEKFGQINFINTSYDLTKIIGYLLGQIDQNLIDSKVGKYLNLEAANRPQNIEQSKPESEPETETEPSPKEQFVPQPNPWKSTAPFIEEKIGAMMASNHPAHDLIDPTAASLKLFAKAITNLQVQEKSHLPTITLTAQDLLELGLTSKDLGSVIKQFKDNNFYSFPSLLLLWEEKNQTEPIGAFLYSTDKTFLAKTAQTFNTAIKGNSILFYTNHRDANLVKQKIVSLI